MIEGAPGNIIWCYDIYPPAYDDMLTTIPHITFVEGVPGDLESMIDPSIRNLVVTDDLMQELCNDQRITNLSSPKFKCDIYFAKYFSLRKTTERYEFKLSLFGFVQISER